MNLNKIVFKSFSKSILCKQLNKLIYYYNNAIPNNWILTRLSSTNTVNIFDRHTKFLQRERAAANENVNLYDYLKDEVGYRLADRVFDIKRTFEIAVDFGTYDIIVLTLPYYKHV